MRLSQLLLAGLHITEKVDGQPGTLPTATALDTSPICQDSWGLLDPCQAQRGFLPSTRELRQHRQGSWCSMPQRSRKLGQSLT